MAGIYEHNEVWVP